MKFIAIYEMDGCRASITGSHISELNDKLADIKWETPQTAISFRLVSIGKNEVEETN